MADFTIMNIDDMRGSFGGGFKLARSELGVSSWGMQVLDIPPGFEDYPEHTDETQEEVFVPLKGSGEIILDGETHALEPGLMVRVGHDVKRKIMPGPEGVRVLALGGVPGVAYEPDPATDVASLDSR
jgi:mannose-6-phosphate isomerase-like protein (cupin superfamily)